MAVALLSRLQDHRLTGIRLGVEGPAGLELDGVTITGRLGSPVAL